MEHAVFTETALVILMGYVQGSQVLLAEPRASLLSWYSTSQEELYYRIPVKTFNPTKGQGPISECISLKVTGRIAGLTIYQLVT